MKRANVWLCYESLTEEDHYDVLNRWDNEKQRRIRDGKNWRERFHHGRSSSVKNCKSQGFKAADKRPVLNDYMI